MPHGTKWVSHSGCGVLFFSFMTPNEITQPQATPATSDNDRIAQSNWAHFVADKDEATTTINSLLTLCMHVSSHRSGELLDHERDALAWALYLVQELQADIQGGVPQ